MNNLYSLYEINWHWKDHAITHISRIRARDSSHALRILGPIEPDPNKFCIGSNIIINSVKVIK